jgi:two-component system chemotaxis sensor kinase CheA
MGSIADESIIAEFVAESRDHLNAIEPDLLAMEQGGPDLSKDLLNRVFRAIHSVKGGAGFLAFESLKGLSHIMESVLMLVRDGRLAVDPALMDAVFAGLDRLRAMLDDIYASDQVPCAEETARFQAILERQGVERGAQVTAQSRDARGRRREFDLDVEGVRSALAKGMNLYHAAAFLHRDIKDRGLTPLAFLNNALSVGRCLDAFIDLAEVPDLASCLEQDLQVTLLFGSVLEADLAAMALGLPPDQVTMLDMPALRQRLKEAKAGPAAPAPPAGTPAGGADGEAGLRPGPTGGSREGAERAPRADNPSAAAEAAQETLRVRVDLLTSLMNQAGELVLSRNQLLRALSGHAKDIPGLAGILQNISQVTSDLQEGIMQTRMQPIGTVFNRIPRIIRDLARQLGKEMEVQVQGAEVELDRSIVELLADPLTHIIRNCADHGIEPSGERLRAGKPGAGQIRVEARHQGGQVVITLADDGRGIDPAKVLAKALARGLVSEAGAKAMTEREIVNLVFAPGFSTADTVTDVSGRGVGMDVVRTNTEKLGGLVELESRPGAGTTVVLRLPLTLAIIPSMIVGVGAERFAIPQVSVVEFVWVRAGEVARRIERVHEAEVLRLRGRLLPLVRLADLLGLPRTYAAPDTGAALPDRRQRLADRRAPAPGGPDRGPDRRGDWRSDYSIVVLRLGSNAFGLVVDELFDTEEIVVKPLSEFVQNCRCFSGATILGDGRVIMILDAGGLAAQARLRFADLKAEELQRSQEEQRRAAEAASRRRPVVVCAGAPGEYFAIPQDQILRMEKIRTGDIQAVGERRYVDYRGRGLPLVRLDRFLEVGPLADGLEEVYMVIPKVPDPAGAGRARAGIVISDIVDALDVDVELEPVKVQGPGILGGAMVQRHFTLFLEPLALLRAAGLQDEARP